MAKYINADELLDYVGNSRKGLNKNEIRVFEMIEIVRCKDCKYCEKSFCSNHRDYCEKHSTLEHTEYVNSTDYCSKGERKETE